MKKLITSLVFAVGAICAYAQSFEYGGLNYNVLSEEDKTCEVGRNSFASGDITIPETVYQYTVTSIGDWAFQWCERLTSITLPEGLISIGEYAFSNCSSLTSIILPESLTSIGESAFSHCERLTSITLPEGFTSIGKYAFSDCTGLTSINIPEGVTSIGYFAFYYCTGLTSINIPEGVTSIGSGAFFGCRGLTSINVTTGNQYYTSIEGVLFSKDLKTFVAYPAGKSQLNYIVPDGVVSIGYSAFSGCTRLTSITLPESVTSIGGFAFSDCTGLTSINIPEGVTSIGYSAFSYCTSLTSINIPEGVTSIGDWVFQSCESLTSISLPEGLSSIGEFAFYHCTGLTSITLPESLTSIGNWAFVYCTSLTSINVATENKNYTSIEGVLFTKDAKTLIVYPAGKSSLYYNVPDGVTSIGNYAFSECSSITSVTLPAGLTSIEYNAFQWCESLTSITLPESLTSIGYMVFAGCTSLSMVNSYATTPAICGYNDVFYGIPSDAVLHVPVGTKDDYASATGWSVFGNIIDDLEPTSAVEKIEIETIDADDSVVVYNLQGLHMNISRRSDINVLPRGIYIVNGKKTLIK